MGKCQAVTASIVAPVIAAIRTAQLKASWDCPDPSTPTAIRVPAEGTCVTMMISFVSPPFSPVHSAHDGQGRATSPLRVADVLVQEPTAVHDTCSGWRLTHLVSTLDTNESERRTELQVD